MVKEGKGYQSYKGKAVGWDRVSSVRFEREWKGEEDIGVRCQTSREVKRRQLLVWLVRQGTGLSFVWGGREAVLYSLTDNSQVISEEGWGWRLGYGRGGSKRRSLFTRLGDWDRGKVWGIVLQCGKWGREIAVWGGVTGNWREINDAWEGGDKTKLGRCWWGKWVCKSGNLEWKRKRKDKKKRKSMKRNHCREVEKNRQLRRKWMKMNNRKGTEKNR